MGKGLLFFCCAGCILVLTVVNLSVGPIVGGGRRGWGTLNCKRYKDLLDDAKDAPGDNDDYIKYHEEYDYNSCIRRKGLHDMEFTAFIFDAVIGFVCGLIGLLHLFDLKKDFVSNTGLIGLACGIVGFVLTFVYVIFNGLVYTTVYYTGYYKRDGDYAFAEKDGNDFKCFYFDDVNNPNSIYPKYSDLGKKQYNYKFDWDKDINDDCKANDNMITSCTLAEKPTALQGLRNDPRYSSCDYLYVNDNQIVNGIENKDSSDRFLTALILSLIVCLANIGLALFGFLLFRNPSDF